MKRNFILMAVACILSVSVQVSASASTGLISQQSVSTKVSVAGVQKEEVKCTGDKPVLQDSSSMFDCLDSTMDFNFSFSSFDFSGMLDKLKSSACNYVNSTVSNYKNQATGIVNSKVNGVTGGVIGGVTSGLNNTLGTQAGGAVNSAIRSNATVSGSITNQGVSGSASQGKKSVNGSYNPFAR